MKAQGDQTYTISTLDEGQSLRLPNLRVTVTLPDRRTISTQLELVPLVLGQSVDCDLVVNDPKVSRRHCELRLTERGVFVEDLDSRNGTFLRDIRIAGAFVPPGVTVSIGDSSFVVAASGASAVIPLSKQGRLGDAVVSD